MPGKRTITRANREETVLKDITREAFEEEIAKLRTIRQEIDYEKIELETKRDDYAAFEKAVAEAENKLYQNHQKEFQDAAKALIKGPAGRDPKSMLDWVSKVNCVRAYPELAREHRLSVPQEKLKLAEAWYTVFHYEDFRDYLWGTKDLKDAPDYMTEEYNAYLDLSNAYFKIEEPKLAEEEPEKKDAPPVIKEDAPKAAPASSVFFEEEEPQEEPEPEEEPEEEEIEKAPPKESFRQEHFREENIQQDMNRLSAFAQQLKDARTFSNSSEYKKLISDIDKLVKDGVGSWDADEMSAKENHMARLVSVKKDIDAYLKHKGRDGVKKNVYRKLAVVEALDAFVSEELNSLDNALDMDEFPDAAIRDDFQHIKETSLNEDISRTYDNVDAISEKVAEVRGLGIQTDTAECSNALRCMDKIIYYAPAGNKKDLQKMQKEFFRAPGEEAPAKVQAQTAPETKYLYGTHSVQEVSLAVAAYKFQESLAPDEKAALSKKETERIVRNLAADLQKSWEAQYTDEKLRKCFQTKLVGTNEVDPDIISEKIYKNGIKNLAKTCTAQTDFTAGMKKKAAACEKRLREWISDNKEATADNKYKPKDIYEDCTAYLIHKMIPINKQNLFHVDGKSAAEFFNQAKEKLQLALEPSNTRVSPKTIDELMGLSKEELYAKAKMPMPEGTTRLYASKAETKPKTEEAAMVPGK